MIDKQLKELLETIMHSLDNLALYGKDQTTAYYYRTISSAIQTYIDERED